MKNKVGILTFHRGNNYGASLQCYALMKQLQKKSENVEVIDFYKEKNYGKKVSVNKMARTFYELLYKKQLKKKNMNFKKFNENQLIISENKNITEFELINNDVNFDEIYEMIVFGSDQIWNMDKKIYDKSNVYYGDFKYSGKKVSYAASFGDNVTEEKNNSEYIIKSLKTFQKISVREEEAKKFLKELGIESELVVDPTLLLTKEEWNNIIPVNRIIKERYILYYSVNCRKYSWKIAQKLSKLTGLKVINLTEHPKIIGSGFKNYYEAGPLEFLNILKNAEYVVTNSFHGTVFSALFKKKMLVAFDEQNGELVQEERKYNLLKQFDLLSTIIKPSDKIELNKIKELNRDRKIESLRKESLEFLNDVLN